MSKRRDYINVPKSADQALIIHEIYKIASLSGCTPKTYEAEGKGHGTITVKFKGLRDSVETVLGWTHLYLKMKT